MDKLTAIKIKYDDGTYSDEIPVSVLSENVEWDGTHTLVDVLGSIDVDVTGTLQDQISQLFNEKVSAAQLQTYVNGQLNIDVTNWLNTNVNPVGSAVVVDKTLNIDGAAADAKKVGEALNAKTDNNTALHLNNLLKSKEDKYGEIVDKPNVVNYSRKLYNVNTKTEADYSNGSYLVLQNLNENEILVISGYAYNNAAYPFYAFFDNENNLINQWRESDTYYNNIYVTVPKNATKIIVEGTMSQLPIIKGFNKKDLKATIESLSQSATLSAYNSIEINNIITKSKSINRMPQLASLISGGYLVNGQLVQDSSKSYTDYIEIDPNTIYTIALVPPYGGAHDPGYGIEVKLGYYTIDKVFIADERSTTFTTPKAAKFIRLNVATGSGINLNRLNSYCMLVQGNEIPSEYSSFEDIKIYPTQLKEELDDINSSFTEQINFLNETTLDYDDNYTQLTSVSTGAGRAYFATTYGVVSAATDNTQKFYIFPVKAGEKYKVYAFGYDKSDSFVCAIFSKFNIIEEGVASKSDPDYQILYCGSSEYPSGYKYHTLFFVPQVDGYIYANSKVDQVPATVGISGRTIKTADFVKTAIHHTYYKYGLYKSGNNYYHFNADGGTNIIRVFLRRGPNNLFQWNQIAFGNVENNILNITKEYSGFGTDIVGPISIWNGDLWPNVWGQWSGGNHDKTIDENHYPTAEQLSFQCLVNGEEIVDDGLYYGEVRFRTTNKLYFPQSITSADLSSAVPAIIEHRDYFLDSQMHVKVRLEVIHDFRCAMYYGMQNVSRGYDTIFCANNDLLIDNTTLSEQIILTKPERKIFFEKFDDNLHYDAELKDLGLGTYSHNDGSNGYGFIANPSSTRKVYYALINSTQQPLIEANSNLLWEGTYYLYF